MRLSGVADPENDAARSGVACATRRNDKEPCVSRIQRRFGALFVVMLLAGSILTLPSASAAAPEITINGDATYTNSTAVTLNLGCPVTLPNCTEVAFSDDGVTFSAYEPFVATKAYNLPAGDGTKTVYVRYRDSTLAESAVYSDSIVLDTTSPSVTVEQATGQVDPTNSGPIQFTATFSEPVTGFGAEDVGWMSTAGPISIEVAESGPMNGTTYTISINWMSTSGTVSASVYAGGAQDVAGNTNTASTSVDNSVTFDIDAPVVSISTDPSDTIAATGWYNRATSGIDGVLVNVGATDPSGVTNITCTNNGTVVLNVAASSGSFVLTDGMQSVVCNATDGAGNTGGASVAIQVDQTLPDVTVPADITAEATGPDGAAVAFTVSASDALTPGITASCSSAADPTVNSGDVFPLGTTTVTCEAIDTAGNSSSASFSITVQDTTAPVVSVPGPISAEATSASGASVSFDVSATDEVTSPLTVTCVDGNGTTVVSGDTFPIGTTTVTCSATDGAGNTGTGSFAITVQDTTAPVVTVPATTIVEATGPDGAVVTFERSATDAVSSPLSVTCVPYDSGATFPLGTTTVTCSATDDAGNSGSASFDIIVEDTTAPVVTVPADIVVDANQPDGAVVTFETSATDAVTLELTVTCGPLVSGDVFPVGTTTIACEATDAAGNTGTASFDVTVRGVSEQFDSLRQLVIDSTLSGSRLTDAMKRIDAAEGYADAGLNSFSCVQLRDLESRLSRYGQVFPGMPGLTAEEIAIARDMIATLQGALGCAGR